MGRSPKSVRFFYAAALQIDDKNPRVKNRVTKQICLMQNLWIQSLLQQNYLHVPIRKYFNLRKYDFFSTVNSGLARQIWQGRIEIS